MATNDNKFHLTHVLEGVAALTGNPATAALLQLLAMSTSLATNLFAGSGVSSGVADTVGKYQGEANAAIDSLQTTVNSFVDAIRNGFTPALDPNKDRHVAAVALATQGTPVPEQVAAEAPGTVPPEVVASS